MIELDSSKMNTRKIYKGEYEVFLYKKQDLAKLRRLEAENSQLKTDCKTLTRKLLRVKPELRGWLEVNYGEYVEQQKDWVNGI